jgi:hypothetical protein
MGAKDFPGKFQDLQSSTFGITKTYTYSVIVYGKFTEDQYEDYLRVYFTNDRA